jgi:hypothetical protein
MPNLPSKRTTSALPASAESIKPNRPKGYDGTRFRDTHQVVEEWLRSLDLPSDLQGKPFNILPLLEGEKDEVMRLAKRKALRRFVKRAGAIPISEKDIWTSEIAELMVGFYTHSLQSYLRGTVSGDLGRYGDFIETLKRPERAVRQQLNRISAALIARGLPYWETFPPVVDPTSIEFDSATSEAILEGALDKHLERESELFEVARKASCEPAGTKTLSLISAVTDAPPERRNRIPLRTARNRVGRKCDFASREASNRSLGEKGEEWVIDYERKRLAAEGLVELASRVDWVSKTFGDGAGYDIRSFNADGTDIFIEVKTTNQGKFAPFFLSINELEFAEEVPLQFRLYRVFDFRDSPRLFILRGIPSDWGIIKPVQFKVVF